REPGTDRRLRAGTRLGGARRRHDAGPRRGRRCLREGGAGGGRRAGAAHRPVRNRRQGRRADPAADPAGRGPRRGARHLGEGRPGGRGRGCMTMRMRDDMTFPPEEYERRIGELRARMQQRLLDAVVITDPENLMYLTDYQTTGYSFFQALVVPLDSEPFMITRQMEESNVIERPWVELTRPYPDT